MRLGNHSPRSPAREFGEAAEGAVRDPVTGSEGGVEAEEGYRIGYTILPVPFRPFLVNFSAAAEQ
jgi:hypothetical protein